MSPQILKRKAQLVPPPATSQRAAALVTVLSLLVLIVILVISFFLFVNHERADADATANQAQARRFGESAVEIIKSAISQATSGVETDANGNPLANTHVSWASQPGLIRTWTQDGRPHYSYRLYSSGQIRVAGSLNLVNEFNEIQNWKLKANSSTNALWTDLNSPVATEDGRLVYPIMAPPADRASGSAAVDSANGVPTDNPDTPAQEGIMGFRVSSAPGFNTNAPPSAGNNPAPMPVKWLYILQDGTFVSPTVSGNNAVVPGATANNPIVGRVAFWTDDESAKVNINTASEGVYWDRPYGANREDAGLANGTLGYSTSVPVQDEFQRLVGHPSFTSLSAVLGPWLPRPSIGFSPTGLNGAAAYSGGAYDTHIAPYYALVPRIGNGGTLGGTRSVTNLIAVTNQMILDPDRLYANAQELLYRPTLTSMLRAENNPALSADRLRRTGFFLTAQSRAPETNLFEQPRISMWPLQQNANIRNAKDRLLARVGSTKRGADIYYFQRAQEWRTNNDPGSSQSATADAAIVRNRQIMEYLRASMNRPVPGFGASLAAKYPDGRLENTITAMFDTIRAGINTTSRALRETPHIPNGYTYAPFATGNWPSYGDATGIGSVLPTITSIGAVETRGIGRFPVITEIVLVFMATRWLDQTRLNPSPPHTPLPGPDGLPDDVPDALGNYNGVGDPQTTHVRAFVLLIPHNPTPGLPVTQPAIRYQIDGLQNFQLNGVNMGFPAGNQAVNVCRSQYNIHGMTDLGITSQLVRGGISAGSVFGKTAGNNTGNTANTTANDAAVGIFPFISQEVALPAPAAPSMFGLDAAGRYTVVRAATPPTTMNFSGGTLTITLHQAAQNTFNSTDFLQQITITIPDAVLPVPQIIRPKFSTGGPDYVEMPDFAASLAPNNPATAQFYTSFNTIAGDGRDFNQRLQAKGLWAGDPQVPGALLLGSLIRRGDVLRSVRLDPAGPTRGDARILAKLRRVPANYYAPHPGYNDPTILQAASGTGRHLRIPDRLPLGYGNVAWNTNPHTWIRQLNRDPHEYLGRLVNLPYQNAVNQNYPNAIWGLTEAQMVGNNPGDWNNGIGSDFDGPIMLMGDQGFVASATSAFENTYFPANIASATNDRNFVTFSPNRQVYSPVLFGSLPAGVSPDAGRPQPAWRTLLFCPNPAAKNNHPGHGSGGVGGPGPDARPPFTIAPDHLFLDYFWMPVVEPYAISEPFSTAGKVNINTQIAPFTHIRRDTALHAAMRAMKMPALPDTVSPQYKPKTSALPGPGDTHFANNPSWRYDIDTYAVLEGMFDRRFRHNDLYRSASELTTIYMVPRRQPAANTSPPGPAGATPLDRYNNTPNWWDDKRLSGDNVRENPYDALYSRITTKSNTYRVHYRAQALRQRVASRNQPGGDPWDLWREDADQVLAEYRGSALIERYVDPDDQALPDFMDPANLNRKLSDHYRWRTIENKQFVP